MSQKRRQAVSNESEKKSVLRITPYEGLNSANQKNRKLGVYGRKLEGSHSPCYCKFDKYKRKSIH